MGTRDVVIDMKDAIEDGFYNSTLENSIRPSFVVYCNNIQKVGSTGRCAEIGVSLGFNAYAMLTHSNITLTLVDSYQKENLEMDNSESEADKRLEPFKDRINFIKKPSIEAVNMFPDGYFDYVYIDGSHKFDDVIQDIYIWYPKVKVGGIFSGHDYFLSDVKNAVQEFTQSHELMVYAVNVFGPQGVTIPWNEAMMCDWWIFKKENQ